MRISVLNKIKATLDSKVQKYLTLSIIVGLLTFFIEFGFVIILQKFLHSLGILSQSIQSHYLVILDTTLGSSIALVLAGIVRAYAYAIKSYCANLTQNNFICNHRLIILSHALNNATHTSTKEAVSVFSDIVTASGTMMNFISIFLTNTIAAIAYFFTALYLAPIETLIGISLLGLFLFPTRSLTKKVRSSGESMVRELELMNGSLISGIKNNFFLKVYNLIPQEISYAEKSISSYKEHIRRFSTISAMVVAFPSVLGLFVLAVLTFFSVRLGTPALKLVSFFYIFLKLVQSLSEINQTLATIRLNYPSLLKLINWEEKMSDVALPQIRQGNISKVSVSHVSHVSANIKKFSYDSNLVLKNLNIGLSKGDVLVIKGPSGVGKSTLLAILLGVLDPTEGSVTIDGKSASAIFQNNPRLLAYVGPEPFLIQGSIRDNLLFGLNESVSDDKIFQALHQVDLLLTIQKLPNQLDQNISEVAELSTGQRQRLSLARAFLRPYDLIVLDEATSNLDSETEKTVIESLLRLSKEKIAIIVTHKNSFDKISTKILDMK